MPGVTAWVLGDRRSLENPALAGADRVLIVQSERAFRSRRRHRQKLHLILVAIRHFAGATGMACLADAVGGLRATSPATGRPSPPTAGWGVGSAELDRGSRLSGR